MVCEEYKHLRTFFYILLFLNNVKKKYFENFHLYFLYISIITEERFLFSFDNKYDFLG